MSTRALLTTLTAVVLAVTVAVPAFGGPKTVSATAAIAKASKALRIARQADKRSRQALSQSRARSAPAEAVAGPAGPAGDSTKLVMTGDSLSSSVPLGAAAKNVLAKPFELAAGSYVAINGTVTVSSAADTDVECWFTAIGPQTQNAYAKSLVDMGSDLDTLPVGAAMYLPSGKWTMNLRCTSNAAATATQAQLNLVAKSL